MTFIPPRYLLTFMLISVFICVSLLPTPDAAASEDTHQSRSIEHHVGHLLSGSGQWRADNPEYEAGSDEPAEYGMNYVWGPHKKHVQAEIISLFEEGRSRKEWSIFITYNPVTDQAFIEQTGKNGVYFRGLFEQDENGIHTETGLIYLPNGQVKSVRDENVMVNKDTRLSNVFERGDDGAWVKRREWTWRQVPE